MVGLVDNMLTMLCGVVGLIDNAVWVVGLVDNAVWVVELVDNAVWVVGNWQCCVGRPG